MRCIFVVFLVTAVLVVPAFTATATLEQRVTYLEDIVHNISPQETAVAPVAAPAHTAWMMVSALLVLMMVLPGLALFYGGMVRQKNVLSILASCFGIAGLVTILWWTCGYSLVFGTNFNSSLLGGTEYFFLHGVLGKPNINYASWIPQNIFCIYQLTFAIITPALIFGATAERIKFEAIILLTFFWMFLIYFPLAHMVWGATGLMNGISNREALIPALDFAGGTVVHMSSGWSGLVLCLLLGKRLGHGKEPMMPHSLVLTVIGTGMLWVGWYGFNAGSALGVDEIATNAFMTTTLAAGVGCFVWPMIEFFFHRKASLLGFCSGAVAGLVVITPACGYVSATGAILIGGIGGLVAYFSCTSLKHFFKYDDALDAFGIHGIGGVVGSLLTAFLATATVNPNLLGDAAQHNGLKFALETHRLWIIQGEAVILTMLYALLGSWLLGIVIKKTVGLRHHPKIEMQGLDINDHGEQGYTLNG